MPDRCLRKLKGSIYRMLPLLLLTVSSCGSAVRWAEVSDVSVDYYDDSQGITYANSEMSFSFPNTGRPMDVRAPLLTFGYDEKAIGLYNGFAERLGKAVFELSDLRRWNRIADYVVRAYAPEGACIMFTVPGKMIACVIDGFTKEELRLFSRMFYVAGKDMSYSVVARAGLPKSSDDSIIYRNMVYDRSLKMYVVSDMLPYEKDGVLCLLYPYDSNFAYEFNTVTQKYEFSSQWGYGDSMKARRKKLFGWWPLKGNWLYTMQSVNEEIDRISSSVLETLKLHRESDD